MCERQGCGELTSVAELLAKLLAMLLKLAMLLLVRVGGTGAALAHLEGHVSVIGWGRSDGPFLFDDVDVASREDTLEAGALVATTPP